MLKYIKILIVFVVYTQSFSQEIDIEKNVILVDGKEWMLHEGCKGLHNSCTLSSKDNEEMIYIKYVVIEGELPSTQSNPKGNLSYIKIKFLGTNKIIELDNSSRKSVVKIIYNSKIINEDFTINSEKLERLVEKYGSPFSDRMNKKSETIIIKQETSEKDSKGVNIKIGF
jgi:hypothetical protein